MGISVPFVMECKVCTHTGVNKVVLHIGPDKGKLLLWYQFTGQGHFHLAGKLAVPGFFNLLHTVPEGGAICKFRRGVDGQHDFRMDNAALVGVVMGQAVPLICQLGSAAIGGCGNGGFALAALYDFNRDMTDSNNSYLLSVRRFRLRGTEQTRSGCLALRSVQGVWGV